MAKDIILTCVAGINYDYINANDGEKNETFLLNESEDLKYYLEERQVNPRIVRGRNVFAGRTLTDKEFKRFADCIALATGCVAIS